MTKMIKEELKRGYDTIGLILSLLMGFGCIIYKNYVLLSHDFKMQKYFRNYQGYVIFNKGNFYCRWLYSYIDPSMLYLFYFMGIIAALPYGVSYYQDKKKGIIRNICIRTEKSHYLSAKYLAVFFTGGTVVALPLVLDLLISKLSYPYDFIRLLGTPLNGVSDWMRFTIDHIYVAALLVILLWFLFGGFLATVSLVVSCVADNVFTIQLIPFLLMLVLFYIPGMLPFSYRRYFPFNFLRINNDIVQAFLEVILLSILTFLSFFVIEKRKDIL